jgi:hypothetical protein
MLIVKKELFSLYGNKLISEASTLVLKPGEWPDFVSVINDKNKGFLFGPNYSIISDGGRIYQGKVGECHILND